jgi:putative nucleotidyltransferase with HDIG domain
MLQSKINDFVKIHTLPNVLTTLLDELSAENSTPASISEIIKNDISLTARLLRAANSAFYRRQSEITTIDTAISILGLKAVKALALSVSMFDITNGKNSQIINLHDFWRHNLEVAVIARQLAAHINGGQPEEAFVCGLLHDLGILFFIQEYEDKYAQVLELVNSDRSFEETEIEVIGMGHSEAGARIASAWRLPQMVCDSIANHHIYSPPGCGDDGTEVWHLVNLAHRCCRAGIDITDNIQANEIERKNEYARSLGFDAHAISRILSGVPGLVLQAASFLDVDIGNPVTLLQQVNEQLGKVYEEYEETLLENEYLHAKTLQQEKSRIALESLRTTLATFSHYVNNATAAIIGRAQILDLYLNQGKLKDTDGKISHSVKIISESVDTICAVLEELKEFPEFKTVAYHGSSRILDIDKNIKAKLGRLA